MSYDAAANAPRSVAAAWRDAQQLGKVVRQKQAHHRASLAAWPREQLEVSDSRRPYFNHFPRAPWRSAAEVIAVKSRSLVPRASERHEGTGLRLCSLAADPATT
jgi:hypothetical protein